MLAVLEDAIYPFELNSRDVLSQQRLKTMSSPSAFA